MMDSRIAAELLYESEATLRMVDTALDELQIDDAESRFTGPRLKAICSNYDTEQAELHIPPEFCVRAYWQIHELLDCVRQSREAVQAIGRADRATAGAVQGDDRSGVDRALALIDRLDTMDDGAVVERHALHNDLRCDLVGMLARRDHAAGSSEQLSMITVLLAETEARLTKLGHLFDSGAGTV